MSPSAFARSLRSLTRLNNSRGVALVAVIWVTGMLALIATSVATSSRTETSLTWNRLENAKARALADAGVHRAILTLLSQQIPNRSSGPGAELANSPDSQTQNAGGPSNMRPDGTLYSWRFEDGTIRLSARQESGKINLNDDNAELLEGLLRSVDLSPQEIAGLVDSVLDFRDPDSEPRAYGREAPDYAALGLGYGPKNRNFETDDELLLVPGMTQAIYRKIRAAVTVYSSARGFNPLYAPLEAFVALPDMDRHQAAAILSRRQAMSAEDFVRSLSASPFYARTAAPVYSIVAEAVTPAGSRFTREAVVALTPNQEPAFHLFTWREIASQSHQSAGSLEAQ
jgi:general secretion pathway protein K